MAQHNLAWMPTLSGDTQAVLVTDKVRYQGQEVACVIAESAYIAKDALELIEVDYEPLDAVTSPQQSVVADAPLIRDEKEGQTVEPRLPLGGGRQGRDRPRLRARPTTSSRSTPSTRAATRRRSSAAAASRTSTRRPGRRRSTSPRRRRTCTGRCSRSSPGCRSRRSGSSAPTSAAASATRCRSTRATSSRRRRRS